MLKPGDCPMTGAQAVAAMTTTKELESKGIERELLELRANMRRTLETIERVLTEVKHDRIKKGNGKAV
jgi:hypothetical protein